MEDEIAKFAWATLWAFSWNFDNEIEDRKQKYSIQLQFPWVRVCVDLVMHDERATAMKRYHGCLCWSWRFGVFAHDCAAEHRHRSMDHTCTRLPVHRMFWPSRVKHILHFNWEWYLWRYFSTNQDFAHFLEFVHYFELFVWTFAWPAKFASGDRTFLLIVSLYMQGHVPYFLNCTLKCGKHKALINTGKAAGLVWFKLGLHWTTSWFPVGMSLVYDWL